MFGQLPYVQYGVACVVFLAFECWVLTTGHLQASENVCVCELRMFPEHAESPERAKEGPAPPYTSGGLGYEAR